MGMVSDLDVRERLSRLRRFFSTDVWEAPLEQLPRARARRYRAARIAYTAAQGLLFSDTLHVRAAALTYFTVLSLVPLLAFVFAILKGFGAYKALVENSLRPYLLATFEGNEALQQAFDQILDFVRNTGVTSLGFLGLLALLYAATRLLRNVEEALNHIWNVSTGRGPLRQLTDYVAIIMVVPMCLLLAAGLGTATQVFDMLRSVEEKLGLGGALEWSIGVLGPYAVIILGLLFLYMVMPNTSVQVRSALLGALIGGVLWYAVLVMHVRFQVGVARFNALYSSFGVIPIFLVWLYVSWLTVMVGAQIAASHQQDRAQAQSVRAASADHDYREAVGLSALLRIAQAFVHGEAPPTLSALSLALDAPEKLLEELMLRAEHAGLVICAPQEKETRFVLGRMPDRILVKDVLDALKRTPTERDRSLHDLPGLAPEVLDTLQALDRELAGSPHNRPLLALLAAEPAPAHALPEPARVPNGQRA
jgi:membrane protein